jgi:hypothetical protein
VGRASWRSRRVMFLLSGILTFIVAPPLPTRALGSSGAYLLEVVIVVAFTLTLVAVAGLHAAQRRSRRYGYSERRVSC